MFSKKATKPNPLLHKSKEEKAETRRKLFLQKVRSGSEDKRFAGGREDEMQQLLILSEERERRVREMILAGEVGVVEEEDMGFGDEEVEVEEVARGEREEVEALVGEWIASSSRGGMEVERERDGGEGFGSDEDEDEDEYEEVFREVLELERQGEEQGQEGDCEMMDMS